MEDGNYSIGGTYWSSVEENEENRRNDIMPITYLLGQCGNLFKKNFFYGVFGCPYTFFYM